MSDDMQPTIERTNLQIIMCRLPILDHTEPHISWVLSSNAFHAREEGHIQKQGVYCIFSHD